MNEQEPSFKSTPEKMSDNPFLSAPQGANPEKLPSEPGDGTSSFSSDSFKYIMGTRESKPFFMVEYYGELPKEFSEQEKNQFIWEPRTVNGETKNVYTIQYGNVPKLSQEEQEQGSSLPPSYHISKPRRFEQFELQDNQHWDEAELKEYLTNKHVMFYTGAGLSINHVPGMKALWGKLGIFQDKPVDDFLQRAIHEPAVNADAILNLRQLMATAPATPGHLSLSNIAKQLNCQVLTENIDQLHERAGTKAFHVTAEELRKRVNPEWFKDVDAIITVGLSVDDRGLLGWYKENNPTGKIVAINIEQPEYLGEGDALVQGDAQRVLPELELSLKPS